MPAKNKKKKKLVRQFNAFSLIEVLIVVAIVALLSVTLFVSVKNHRVKAQDAKIKMDLETLRIAFENYYNDNNCYPPADWFDSADDCGANYLSPYINSLPCDPKTGVPYQLEYTANQCSGFKLYASLSNTNDPAVTDLCIESGGSTLGNYGVSSTNTTVGIDCSVIIASSPSPSPLASSLYPPGPYACQGTTCNNFGTQAAAVSAGCPATFADSSCNSLCLAGNPAYLCP